MAVTFSGVVVGANRRYPEAVAAVLPVEFGRDFFAQLQKAGNGDFGIPLGSDGRWLYHANVMARNIFLTVTPVSGRLTPAQVKDFQAAHMLDSEYIVFSVTGVSDPKIHKQIRQNLVAGRPWDEGCNF